MKTYLMVSALILPLIAITILNSCKKSNNSEGSARLQVYLTDDPGDYEAVYIDVKDVQINVTGGTNDEWQSLQGVKATVYDVMKLVNDDDTLLADSYIPSGKIHQLRLVLGSENYVKIEGTNELIKLETPSAQQSGLKLNIQQDVQDGILYTITLDFDVSKSIVKTGNNKYILKPTIRTVLNAVGGTIRGIVMPKTFQSAVYAVQGVDTIASTFTDTDGGYMLRGLPVGAYGVFYKPSDATYKDSLRINIPVTLNTVTTVDTTFLHQ